MRSKKIIIYYLLACAFSWFFWIPQVLAAHGTSLPKGLSAFLDSSLNPAAFGPLVSALVMVYSEKRWPEVVSLLRKGWDFRFSKVWLIPVLLLPPLLYAAPILLAAFIQPEYIFPTMFSDPLVVVLAPLVILLTGGPLQEEFGWRGYALPRLQESFNGLISSVILGVGWWLWHLPLVFIPGKFLVGSLSLYSLLMIEIVMTSIIFTWIYNNTNGSIAAALLFHTFMNWSIWVVLPGMQVTSTILVITIAFQLIFLAILFGFCGFRLDTMEKVVISR